MYIPRYYDLIEEYLKPKKVLVIYGPRQVGKTTMVQNFLNRTKLKYRFETGENIQIQNLLSVPDQQSLNDFVAGYDLLVVDEAQLIPNIGRSLKLLVDTNPKLSIIATGSSAFELAGQVGEPLTGRKKTLTMFPVSMLELKKELNTFDLGQNLDTYLIYGTYPEVLNLPTKQEKQSYLNELIGSSLLKDVLALQQVKSSKVLVDLLRLLAFQIGSEVSLNELGQKLNLDIKTVSRYLDLLEKAYIIFELRGFSRNLRNEITKKSKFYFFDNGLRNAVISSFNGLNLRNDLGMLWENFVLVERLKKRYYKEILANSYFWRTWEKAEIDLIEERDGNLFAFEIKYTKENVKVPSIWTKNYPESEFTLVNQTNIWEFIT